MRIMSIICRLVLPVCVMAFCTFHEAGAQPAAGSAPVDVQQACTPDAMRLCADTIPDVPKTTACMKAKRAQLSKECRTAMAGGSGGHRTHRHYRHTRHTN